MSVRTITGRQRPQNAEELTAAIVHELRHPSKQNEPESLSNRRAGATDPPVCYLGHVG